MSRRLRWVGPAMQPGGVAGPTHLTALHEAYGQQLAEFVEMVRTGKAFSEQTTAERISIRLLGALMHLHQRHRVDERGRCSICRSAPRAWWWPWPKRSACTVHTALGFFLRQPDRFVRAAITDNTPDVQGAS